LSNTLIIVEGQTDEGFIKGIADRLQAKCKVLVMRGNRADKAHRLLKAHMGNFNKAAVLKDIHRAGVDTTAIIDQLASKIKQLETQKIQLRVFPVKRSIEAWILAGLCLNNPEEILNPEEELKKLMQREGKHYIKSPEIYTRIADEIDIEKAKKASKTFKDFIDFLTT